MPEKLKDGIYRIKIPFDNIYTTAFILTSGNNAIILDSGSNDSDAERYIIPVVRKTGLCVKYIVSSHTHEDHHGGRNALTKAFPKAVAAQFSREVSDSYYLTDGEMLLGRFQMLNLKGHSDDSLGVLDTKTATLLSCDSLQLYGVGKYKTYIPDRGAYAVTLQRVRDMGLQTIIASHEYEPCGSVAEGEEKVNEYIRFCE